jgi:hypothetical protein
MDNLTPVTVELDIGHTDPAGKKHTRVTFGRRISGKQVFDIDANPQSQIPTQNSDLLMIASITEFGALKMPVSLLVLLKLDSLDREDLSDAFQRFLDDGLGDRKVEYPSVGVVKMAIGYESNGLAYDLVEFGTRLTGMDEVEADKLKLNGIKRVVFLCGRQISKLKQTDGTSELDGPIGLDIFEQLDLVDIGAIRTAAEVWRYSFRRPGARISQ